MVASSDNAALAREAARLYETRLKAILEPAHAGHFVVVNLDTGEYEVDPEDLAASARAKSRFGAARLFTLRVGRSAAYRLGASAREPGPC